MDLAVARVEVVDEVLDGAFVWGVYVVKEDTNRCSGRCRFQEVMGFGAGEE